MEKNTNNKKIIDTASVDLADIISQSTKKTPSIFFLKLTKPLVFDGCDVFGADSCVVLGDYDVVMQVISDNLDAVDKERHFCFAKNSGVALSKAEKFDARIEPGAIVRDMVTIGKKAVILMGAVINIGAEIGENTMIDMNAVVGARARIGKNCHVGAGAVVAGVLEPPSATPVIVGDNVMIGANAVLLEGVCVGDGAVIAAGAVVAGDVPCGCVAAGSPAKIIKRVDDKTRAKTRTEERLRW